MSFMDSDLPIIDFSSYSIDKESIEEEDLQKLSEKIDNAFSNVGYMYLKNHGIPEDLINAAEKAGADFFDLADDIKQKYSWDLQALQGWQGLGIERVNRLERPADYKECLNIIPQRPRIWPDDKIPGFTDTLTSFHKQCDALAKRVMEVLAVGLGLERNFFKDFHHTFERPNPSTTKLCRYPPVEDDTVLKEKQIRCGEHTDYITFTFVFQDDNGGFEVLSKEGHFVEVTPVEDTILVIISEMLQRWTEDKYVATKHRVVIPEDETKRRRVRRSIVYFISPDNDCVINGIHGGHKYPPVNADEYLAMRLTENYK